MALTRVPSLVGNVARPHSAQGLPYVAMVRAQRRCFWALVALLLLHILSLWVEFGFAQNGWSLMLGQGALQGTCPRGRVPTAITSPGLFARESVWPIVWWFQFGAGVLYSVAIPLWAIALAPFARLIFLIHYQLYRDRPARCEGCGYDLAAAQSGRCPECGWRRDWLKAFRRGLFDRS